MDAILGSYKWRDRLERVWLLLTIGVAVAALHQLTDFDVTDIQWWLYLVKVVIHEEGLNKIPAPYVFYLIASPIAYFGGVVVLRYGIKVKLYGFARKATKRDIKKMRLDDGHGQVLGSAHGKTLKNAGARHTMVIAGTEGGKTQGYSIPTAFEYKGSMVVVDPEGEIWAKTAGKRAEFTDCYRLEFVKGSGETARYNPLSLDVLPDEPSEIERRVDQLARIIAPEPKDFWDKAGIKFAATLCLLEVFDAIHEKRDALITNVAHWTGDIEGFEEADDPIKEKIIEASKRAQEHGYPRRLVSALNDLARTPYKQREGAFESLNVELEPFRSSAVEYALSGCDFSWRTLVDGDRPATIYLVFAADDRQYVSTMMTALISNFILSLVSRPEDLCKQQHQVLFLIEEFSALKKTEALIEIFDRGRKHNVHVGLNVQNLSQIEEKYSPEVLRTMENSTEYTVVFGSNDRSLQERYSHKGGQTTRRRESHSDGDRSESVSEGYEGRALVLPQSVGELAFGEHILFVKGHLTRPVFCKTPLAFQNKHMEKWMQIPPPPVVPGLREAAI